MEKNFDRRGKSRNKNKLRNLPQYRDMSEEELDAALNRMDMVSTSNSKDLEKRIDEKLSKFEEDYDLSDLKINDREVLRALIRDIISLEDYEAMLFDIRSEGVTPENLMLVEKLQKAMNDLKKSISDAQNDLSITRKHRKSDQETTVIAYIESLNKKARKFYESRMQYIFCEKCNTLLATIWTLYPEQDNKISLTCQQKNKKGEPCGHVTVVNTKKLIDNRGTNNREVMPDALL